MGENTEMEKVLADLETKTESLAGELSEIKQVLEMIRKEYHLEASLEKVDTSSLILSRADELDECCECDSECLSVEEGKEDFVLLSNLSKRKIKTKDILLCIKISCLGKCSSNIYLCTDRVVVCTGDEEGNNMDIFLNEPYDAISDIGVEVDGDDAWLSIITNQSKYGIDGEDCHQRLFELIRTILWDCYEYIKG